jgi:uncharacterized protein
MTSRAGFTGASRGRPALVPREGEDLAEDLDAVSRRGLVHREGRCSRTRGNVTACGAFVDLGVKQDGLVHVSELADRFVKDPSEVVRLGDSV